MTYSDLHELVVENTSRSIILGGMGCVHVFVPVRDVKKLKNLLSIQLATNVHSEVSSLSEQGLKLRKGVHELGILPETFIEVCDKYFSKGIK